MKAQTETEITREEYEIVDKVAGGFMRRMRWNHRWEEDDVRQELLVYWLKKKQSGWSKPGEWKGAMGRCLQTYLINLQKKECTQKRQMEGQMISLDQLIEEGREFPDRKPASSSLDFLALLNKQERVICALLVEGKTKTEIAQFLKRSRWYVAQRIQHVRQVLEKYFQK